MDDMKRAMYIAARNALQNEGDRFICSALKNELREQAMSLDHIYSCTNGYVVLEQLMEELFSEFFDLYDYPFWGEDYLKGRHNDDKHLAWFGYYDKKRRLAILDFIIANR